MCIILISEFIATLVCMMTLYIYCSTRFIVISYVKSVVF